MANNNKTFTLSNTNTMKLQPIKSESPNNYTYQTNVNQSSVSSNCELSQNNFDKCDSSNNMILRKRVNFKLNNNSNINSNPIVDQQGSSSSSSSINNFHNQNNKILVKFDGKPKYGPLNMSRMKKSPGIIDLKTREMCPLMMTRETKIKNVVYNGTFPIDNPISSRFDGSHENDDNDDEADEEDYYKEDGEEDEEYDEDDFGPEKHPSYTMKELIANKNIKINYNKMKFDFQQSFMKFDQFLDRRGGTGGGRGRAEIKEIRSFDIDEPM